MKTLHIKHIIGGLLFVGSVALLSACSGTDDIVDTTAGVSGLKVSLAIGDASLVQTASRAETPSDASLNEDKIANLNLFFYNTDGALAQHYYLTDGLGSGLTKLLSSGSQWTAALKPGSTYNVYAVANYNADLSGKTLTEVQALTQTDANIYKQYDASTNSSKTFLMDGSVLSWTVPTGNDDVTIPLTLKRAADKIVFKISLDGTTLNATDAAWSWKLVNYSTNTSVLSEQTVADKGVATTAEQTLTPSGNSASLTTYTFDNSWTGNAISGQTMIEVNIPCKYTDANGKTTDYSINKYRLPVTTLSSTGRNNIYQITAKLDKLGNTNTDQNYSLSYAVKTWVTYNINIDDSNAKYLIVSPETVILKNEANYKDIKYYSSSKVNITNIKAYYYDPLQKAVEVKPSDYNITATLDNPTQPSGTVTFHSDIPNNLGPRYIELTFINTDGISRKVLIKQYPLEYITAIAGSFSYKDDGTNDLGTAPHKLSTYNPLKEKYEYGDYKDTGWYHEYYYSDDMFDSKYFNTYIYYSGSNRWSGGQDNNNMYVVRITSTSDKYKIDKPLITNGVTDGSANNNDVVSPAFMLASQLGTVQAKSWSKASDHCKRYVEVASDGTRYADWRLPTLAELEIIAKYQDSENNDVMDIVLAGDYYWSAYNEGSIYGCYGTGKRGGKTGRFTNRTTAYIRCIRDLTPAELANDK